MTGEIMDEAEEEAETHEPEIVTVASIAFTVALALVAISFLLADYVVLAVVLRSSASVVGILLGLWVAQRTRVHESGGPGREAGEDATGINTKYDGGRESGQARESPSSPPRSSGQAAANPADLPAEARWCAEHQQERCPGDWERIRDLELKLRAMEGIQMELEQEIRSLHWELRMEAASRQVLMDQLRDKENSGGNRRDCENHERRTRGPDS